MIATQSLDKISAALLKAQVKIQHAVKDAKNPFFKSSYADLNSVIESCKQHLNDEGIVVLQPMLSDGANDYLETTLLHAESGQFIVSKMRLLPPKNMQDYGSAISYARRYSLQALVFVGAEDDDGERTMERPEARKPTQIPKTPNHPSVLAQQSVDRTPATNRGFAQAVKQLNTKEEEEF